MNGWLIAAAVLLVAAMGPGLWAVTRGDLKQRLIAQNLGSVAVCLVFLLAAQGFRRPSYVDLALVLAVLGPAGTLIFARFLEVLPRSKVLMRTAWAAVPLTVVPLCVAAGPGRAMAKLLVIGVLLLAGSVVTTLGVPRE